MSKFCLFAFAFLLGCSANKTVLKTVSFGEFFTHHPISVTSEIVAKDLDSQLTSFKGLSIAVENFTNSQTGKSELLGMIFAEELKTALARLGYVVFARQLGDSSNAVAQKGNASIDFSLEGAQLFVNGVYFQSPKRLSISVQAIDPKTNLVLAATSASVLRTEEIDNLIKASRRKSLITFERLPVGLFF
ncbi:MAG: FlgO family outer membrane protein [Deltaproteobacteria bacterium]|nr:FlgO family outer membrane protein [Deltaproteobacteria bacterium]